MFFHIRWALKNLLMNTVRSVKKIVFISLSLFMVLACMAIIDGAGNQMKTSIYNSLGDISGSTRLADENMAELISELGTMIKEPATILGAYNQAGLLSTKGGYAQVSIQGVEPEYLPYFEKTIGWTASPKKDLARGSVLLDARLAKKMQVGLGDFATVKIQTEDGFVNTIQLEIDGIFMGNPYLYENVIICNLADVRELFLQDDEVNMVRVFFADSPDESVLSSYASMLEMKYSQLATFSTRGQGESGMVFMFFGYYRMFLIAMLSLVIITFLVILNFAMQNIYFIEFRARRKELATLLTFGMKPSTLLAVVSLETLFAFVVALLISCLVLFATGGLLSLTRITALSMQELVALLGGNSLMLSYDVKHLGIFMCIVFVISLYSSLLGSRNYLKMHIREIISGS